MSGAGRSQTRRSARALAARLTTDAASRWTASAFAPGLDLPVRQRGQVLRESGVDRAPVVRVQAGGLPGDDGGSPLADPTVAQVLPGVGQLVGQGLGQAQVPRPARRGLPPGQGDLSANPAAPLTGRHPRRGLDLPLRGVERHRHGGLGAGTRVLHRLQHRDLVDALDVRHCGVQGGQALQEVLELRGGEGSRGDTRCWLRITGRQSALPLVELYPFHDDNSRGDHRQPMSTQWQRKPLQHN